jgi:hypothetical protein
LMIRPNDAVYPQRPSLITDSQAGLDSKPAAPSSGDSKHGDHNL